MYAAVLIHSEQQIPLGWASQMALLRENWIFRKYCVISPQMPIFMCKHVRKGQNIVVLNETGGEGISFWMHLWSCLYEYMIH